MLYICLLSIFLNSLSVFPREINQYLLSKWVQRLPYGQPDGAGMVKEVTEKTILSKNSRPEDVEKRYTLASSTQPKPFRFQCINIPGPLVSQELILSVWMASFSIASPCDSTLVTHCCSHHCWPNSTPLMDCFPFSVSLPPLSWVFLSPHK